MKLLELGSSAPQLSALDQDGTEIVFGDIYKKGTTLVYFYPKAATPGCTAEACSLRDSFTTLRDREGKQIQILGVSRDTPAAQKKFQQKQQLPFPLIADRSGEVAKAFGVKLNPLLGFTSRESFLISDGKIAWLSRKAKTSGAAQEIQEALQALE
ncbi:MAG: redoxin domain-containing protein [Chthoniobacterales bacterium]|nr:redoxin domain-containing protein [Chthoniobacterales bacterium]